MPVVGGPDIELTFATAHAVLALTVFVAPGAIALVVEPIVFLLADRYPRRWFIRAGLAGMSLGAFAAALAPDPIALAIALGFSYIASGTCTALAQATLVDRFAAQRARALARWTLWSVAGDMLAPALLAGLALAGASWRWGFVAIGVVLLVWLAALSAASFEVSAPKDDAELDGDGATTTDDRAPARGLWATLRDAITDPLLVAWLFGTALCDLLDEILVVFASLHLRIDLHAGPFWQSLAIAAFTAGDALGLVALERLLKTRSERGLLAACAAGCIAAYVPWLLAPTPLAATLLAIPVGMFVGPLYPLAAAQAYACRPDQSGTVLAAGHLFTPMGLILPFAIGALADAAGTTAALAVLVIQPVGLLVLVAVTRRQSG